jgi:hypothetical protein
VGMLANLSAVTPTSCRRLLLLFSPSIYSIADFSDFFKFLYSLILRRPIRGLVHHFAPHTGNHLTFNSPHFLYIVYHDLREKSKLDLRQIILRAKI